MSALSITFARDCVVTHNVRSVVRSGGRPACEHGASPHIRRSVTVHASQCIIFDYVSACTLAWVIVLHACCAIDHGVVSDIAIRMGDKDRPVIATAFKSVVNDPIAATAVYPAIGLEHGLAPEAFKGIACQQKVAHPIFGFDGNVVMHIIGAVGIARSFCIRSDEVAIHNAVAGQRATGHIPEH